MLRRLVSSSSPASTRLIVASSISSASSSSLWCPLVNVVTSSYVHMKTITTGTKNAGDSSNRREEEKKMLNQEPDCIWTLLDRASSDKDFCRSDRFAHSLLHSLQHGVLPDTALNTAEKKELIEIVLNIAYHERSLCRALMQCESCPLPVPSGGGDRLLDSLSSESLVILAELKCFSAFSKQHPQDDPLKRFECADIVDAFLSRINRSLGTTSQYRSNNSSSNSSSSTVGERGGGGGGGLDKDLPQILFQQNNSGGAGVISMIVRMLRTTVMLKASESSSSSSSSTTGRDPRGAERRNGSGNGGVQDDLVLPPLRSKLLHRIEVIIQMSPPQAPFLRPHTALDLVSILGATKNRNCPELARRAFHTSAPLLRRMVEEHREDSGLSLPLLQEAQRRRDTRQCLDALKACVSLWSFPAAFLSPLLQRLAQLAPAFTARQLADACLCLCLMGERDARSRKRVGSEIQDSVRDLRRFAAALDARAQKVRLSPRQAKLVVVAMTRSGVKCGHTILQSTVPLKE